MSTSAPKRPAPRRRMLLLAGGFYALLGLGALAWGLIAGRPNLYIPGPRPPGPLAHCLGPLAGLLFGLLVVAASRAVERFSWARELNRFFASVLGPVSWMEAATLAALSSVGEELFFRGAMQPSLGLYWTSLIFAAVHLPPRARLLGWTALAGVMGLCFGLAADMSGNLGGPILAHFTINLFNLRHVARYATIPPEIEAKATQPQGVQPSEEPSEGP